MENLMKMIARQQGAEGTVEWMIGEQLKEIAAREPASAALLEKDLDVAAMSLTNAAHAMKAFSDQKRAASKEKKSCVCITPKEADEVLRKFYGLPTDTEEHAAPVNRHAPVEEDGDLLNLDELEDLWEA
jgi:hypothetical protein